MKANEFCGKIRKEFPYCEVTEKYENQFQVTVKPEHITGFAAWVQSQGFEHLSNMTCVDWIDRGVFQVVYNIWSYRYRLHMVVKSNVNRKASDSVSIGSLWPQAKVYEQEIHEMFGVRFAGNPNMGPLFLHNWKDIPPLRKDFDTEEYSRQAYGFLDDEAPAGDAVCGAVVADEGDAL